MRIAYGIFGYGRGHATRAAAVLPALTAKHSVLILAGGDAYAQLCDRYSVVKIPTLGYVYSGEKRSNWLTLRQNLWNSSDILFGGPTSKMVSEQLADFSPDVVISDAEPWTHQAARRLGVPRIGFDHFGILVYCRPPIPVWDWLESRRDVWVYRRLMGVPERVIVSSFYDAPARRAGVACIGPLLRDEVLRVAPREGEHLLVYFNKGRHQYTSRIESAFRALETPVVIYGTDKRGRDGLLDYRPPSNVPFIEDLASCRALLCTAGNQLVGEALHFGKPLLVTPESCVEQRLNASAVRRLGIGIDVRHADLDERVIGAFLENLPAYSRNIARHRRDGRREALDTIEQFLAELAPAAVDAVSATASHGASIRASGGVAQ